MKKGLLLALIALLIFTGCGKKDESSANNSKDNTKTEEKAKKEKKEKKEKKQVADTVVCTSKLDEAGMTATMQVEATFAAGIVNNAKVSLVFDDESVAGQYCSLFEMANSMAENENDKVDFTCKGKTLTFNSYADFVESESEEDDSDIVGLTKAEFIKSMEATEGVTCK